MDSSRPQPSKGIASRRKPESQRASASRDGTQYSPLQIRQPRPPPMRRPSEYYTADGRIKFPQPTLRLTPNQPDSQTQPHSQFQQPPPIPNFKPPQPPQRVPGILNITPNKHNMKPSDQQLDIEEKAHRKRVYEEFNLRPKANKPDPPTTNTIKPKVPTSATTDTRHPHADFLAESKVFPPVAPLHMFHGNNNDTTDRNVERWLMTPAGRAAYNADQAQLAVVCTIRLDPDSVLIGIINVRRGLCSGLGVA